MHLWDEHGGRSVVLVAVVVVAGEKLSIAEQEEGLSESEKAEE